MTIAKPFGVAQALCDGEPGEAPYGIVEPSTPRRIQLQRTKGWRKPVGAIVVSRPTEWGNPYRVQRMPNGQGWRVIGNGSAWWGVDGFPMSKERAVETAVDIYRRHCGGPKSNRAYDIRIRLGGHDLCCWCRLDAPCHADVLLAIANTEVHT